MGERSASNPGRLPSVLPNKETGWDPEPVWTLWGTEVYYDPAGNRHDSSVSSPYPSHYIDCAIPGPTTFLIVSTFRRCILWNQFPTFTLHVTWKIYRQLLPKLCELISFAYRCVTCARARLYPLFIHLSVRLRTFSGFIDCFWPDNCLQRFVTLGFHFGLSRWSLWSRFFCIVMPCNPVECIDVW
jgi:hypothetical protein